MKPKRVDYASATMNGEDLGEGSLVLRAVFREGRGKIPLFPGTAVDAWWYEGPFFDHYVVTDLTGTLAGRSGDALFQWPGWEMMLYGLHEEGIHIITSGSPEDPLIHMYAKGVPT